MSEPRGIPTTYRGINFRSRAEACWAAFFDHLEWTWSYEPIDLAGYIPDFLVAGHEQTLVEVKGGEVAIHPLNNHVDKIERSGWDKEAVIVAAHPCKIGGDEYGFYYVLGVGARPERVAGSHEWDWQSFELIYCLSCGRVSFINPSSSWACRMCGCDDGNAHIGDASEIVRTAWASAKNRVQWRAA